MNKGNSKNVKDGWNIKALCIAALFTALVFFITRFFQIPIPLGYFNLGNSAILLGCLFLPARYGIPMGALGSVLADLTSYPLYSVPTLIIKAAMSLFFYVFYGLFKGKGKATVIISAAIAMLIPLFGYTLTGCILYGSLYTGLLQLPGLLAEYGANLLLFALLYGGIYKRKEI